MTRILIVEDNRSFADALACALEVEGYDVLVADNAADGIQLGLSQCPDVVISDWMLRNEVHGGEVCRRIRVACREVKIIIITGHQEFVSKARRYCERVEAVIEKPFHKEEILSVVRHALSNDLIPTSDDSRDHGR